MKGEDGIPIPHPDTGPGLIMTFKLASEGKNYREIAKALNDHNYRTAGNQGNRPFTKDTVRGMLQNRFYLGELPDGNGGWIEAKHQPFVSQEVFDAAMDQTNQRSRNKIGSVRSTARIYSLSGICECSKCESRMGMHMGPQN
ncbi:MAG: hypothetical protein GY852_10150, partial [bacterium]|nr:hypothetical protein [bacterium]